MIIIELTGFMVVQLITALTLAILAGYVWKRRSARGGFYFSLLLAAAAWWAFFDAFDMSGFSLSTNILLTKLSYAGIVSVAPLWLLFTLSYSRHDRCLTRNWIMLVWIIPLVIYALALTNEWHGLMWSTITTVTIGSGSIVNYGHGIGDWVLMFYSYALVFIGMVLLVSMSLSYRKNQVQTAGLIIGAILPLAGNLIYFAQLTNLAGVDFTPFALCITGILYSYLIFGWQLFDIMPVASDTLISSMADGIIVLGRQNRVLNINPAAGRLVGSGTDEVIGEPAQDVLSVWPELKTYIIDKQVTSFQIRTSNESAPRWLEVSNTPLVNFLGTKTGCLIILRDITERKQAEEALRNNEEMYRGLVEEISDWICDVDERFVCTYSSPRVRHILGYEPEEVVGRSAFDFIHPEEADWFKAMFTPGYRPRPGFDLIQCRLLRRDGSPIWVEVSGKPVFDSQGHFKCNRGLIRDITERKRAEEALQSSETMFRTLFENVGAAIIMVDFETGAVMDCNSNAERLFGRYRDEIIRMNVTQLHPPVGDTPGAADLARQARQGLITNAETEALHKDGTRIPVILRITPMVISGKKIVVGVFLDITERKRAEEELANAKAQSELYVDLMGHDINNMHQVALGYLELLSGMVEDEKLKQLISKPMEVIDKSSRLIENVRKLQLSRTGNYRMEAYDLGELVEEVASRYKSRPEKYVHISCGAIKGIRVQANELLRDVFANLIENAIKHSTGPSSINIRMSREGKGARTYCSVIIDDNGPGVPDDMKDRLFNRLQRGDTKAKGSGLGLYLVKSLVESYGGGVRVEDRVPGDHRQGARFIVELPVIE